MPSQKGLRVDIGDVRGTEEAVFTLTRVTLGSDGTTDGRVSAAGGSLTVTILDSDDTSVTVRFGSIYQIVREDRGSVNIPVTISASPVEDVTINLRFDTEDDTATYRYDYTATARG